MSGVTGDGMFAAAAREKCEGGTQIASRYAEAGKSWCPGSASASAELKFIRSRC